MRRGIMKRGKEAGMSDRKRPDDWLYGVLLEARGMAARGEGTPVFLKQMDQALAQFKALQQRCATYEAEIRAWRATVKLTADEMAGRAASLRDGLLSAPALPSPEQKRDDDAGCQLCPEYRMRGASVCQHCGKQFYSGQPPRNEGKREGGDG